MTAGEKYRDSRKNHIHFTCDYTFFIWDCDHMKNIWKYFSANLTYCTFHRMTRMLIHVKFNLLFCQGWEGVTEGDCVCVCPEEKATGNVCILKNREWEKEHVRSERLVLWLCVVWILSEGDVSVTLRDVMWCDARLPQGPCALVTAQLMSSSSLGHLHGHSDKHIPQHYLSSHRNFNLRD